jgi:proline-specific peptidase
MSNMSTLKNTHLHPRSTRNFMSAMATVTDGLAFFEVPSAGGIICETYYKIAGSLTDGKRPLLVLHGGPGSTHDYTLPLVHLHTTYGIPLIFYDQLGSGRSTHLKEKMGDTTFWTEELFMDELDNLIKVLGLSEFNVLGHSWGGMLAMRWAARRQAGGLRRLVVSNSPASMPLFVEGAMRLRKELPEAVQASCISTWLRTR